MEGELENIGNRLEKIRIDTAREIEGLSLVELKQSLQRAYEEENEVRRSFEGLDLNNEPAFQEICQRRAVIEKAVHKIEPWTGEVSAL